MYLTPTGIVADQKDNGCLVLSFRGDHIEQLCADGQLPSGVRVGYMEGKRPLSPRSRYRQLVFNCEYPLIANCEFYPRLQLIQM